MLSAAPKNGPDGHLQLHASTVVIGARAVAITGPSGSGKSGFALALMSRGAILLSDDITWVQATDAGLIAHCPPNLSARIEARGIGILNATPAPPTPLYLIVDLGTLEPDRMPARKSITLLGHDIRVLHTPATPYFIDAVVHYIMHGQSE